jgi:hypothetical protein
MLSYRLILKPAKRNDEESKPTVSDALCLTAILKSESCASSALTPGTPGCRQHPDYGNDESCGEWPARDQSYGHPAPAGP